MMPMIAGRLQDRPAALAGRLDEALAGYEQLLAVAPAHFDALLLVAMPCGMRKLAKVEIGIEFPIDSAEQVQVEGCRHPSSVVVGRLEDGARFLQIHADQEAAARAGAERRAGLVGGGLHTFENHLLLQLVGQLVFHFLKRKRAPILHLDDEESHRLRDRFANLARFETEDRFFDRSRNVVGAPARCHGAGPRRSR